MSMNASPRSVCVELDREIHAGGLQDLVRATQLEHFLAQLLDLLALLAGGQIRPQAAVASACRTRLRSTS